MNKNRLEAFSDGVIAIIITIMVLALKPPQGTTLHDLLPLLPEFTSYAISFVYVGIYWNNHHHMLQVANKVNGTILWANMHLLFWLSLIPFCTDWADDNHVEPIPIALYGVVLFMSGFAYYLLARAIICHHGTDSKLAQALGKDRKGKISLVIYAISIGFAFVDPSISIILYVSVALMWLVPDSRIEKKLTK